MKKAYHFPAISHFCDVAAEEYGKTLFDTQRILNAMSMENATTLEFLLMRLHREQNHNLIGLATGEGWDMDEMIELHPDMGRVMDFHDAIMMDDLESLA